MHEKPVKSHSDRQSRIPSGKRMERLPGGRLAEKETGGLRQRMKRNRLTQWWRREWPVCLRAAFLACLPVIACLVYCAVQGRSIGQVYLPASVRNDELIYYKQVEAIIQYGYPQGYFGFNESHALKLSFAAWSPVLVLPWVLWGVVFGWNLLSPVLCNIVLLTIALFLFGLLAKPDWKQTGLTAFLFFLYVPFAWYMLSGMPEIGCISLLIVFYGAAVAYLRKKRGGMLALLFALSGLLTLMRPYLLLFLLLPAYFWIAGEASERTAEDTEQKGMKKLLRWVAVRWKGILGSCAVLTGVLGIYAWINHYLAAEYLEPLFYMDWLTAFFEKGLLGGFKNFFGLLYYSGVEFARYMWQGVVSGLPSGAIFCCYIVVFLLLIYQSLRDFLLLRRRRRTGEASEEIYGQLVLEGHLTIAFLGMLGAQLLMYNFYDGCKHLLTFLALSVFVVGMMRTVYFKKAVLVGAVFAWFFLYRGDGFQDYLPDFTEPQIAADMERWNEAVGQELVLTGEERPNYDNVVIWVLSDELPQGMTYTGWQYLYSVPAGFGISCCTSDYIMEHFDSLESKYICVVPGGPVEENCIQMGYGKIIGNEHAALYARRQ